MSYTEIDGYLQNKAFREITLFMKENNTIYIQEDVTDENNFPGGVSQKPILNYAVNIISTYAYTVKDVEFLIESIIAGFHQDEDLLTVEDLTGNGVLHTFAMCFFDDLNTYTVALKKIWKLYESKNSKILEDCINTVNKAGNSPLIEFLSLFSKENFYIRHQGSQVKLRKNLEIFIKKFEASIDLKDREGNFPFHHIFNLLKTDHVDKKSSCTYAELIFDCFLQSLHSYASLQKKERRPAIFNPKNEKGQTPLLMFFADVLVEEKYFDSSEQSYKKIQSLFDSIPGSCGEKVITVLDFTTQDQQGCTVLHHVAANTRHDKASNFLCKIICNDDFSASEDFRKKLGRIRNHRGENAITYALSQGKSSLDLLHLIGNYFIDVAPVESPTNLPVSNVSDNVSISSNDWNNFFNLPPNETNDEVFVNSQFNFLMQ